jgi:hypothetical protein
MRVFENMLFALKREEVAVHGENSTMINFQICTLYFNISRVRGGQRKASLVRDA